MFQRLKLQYDELLSNLAFKSNLRRYDMAPLIPEEQIYFADF
jgi:hypothetical protein